ncbi:hypothetical protein OWV82_016686 [Melia azedarach]|uniref:Uncharacterized protein n=1 Tax=Melia azedarach TaxID=155640 RepID=A0ACC1XGF1_MELAZ|nr:hypothetical protein OWV82_016686 [Melia azedarach]
MERVREVEEDARLENDNHVPEDGETISSFRSFKGMQNTEQPLLQQHLDSSIWEHGLNVYEDDITTMEGGIPQSCHNVVQPPVYYSCEPDFVGIDFGVEREFRNIVDKEETQLSNPCLSLVYRISPMRAYHHQTNTFIFCLQFHRIQQSSTMPHQITVKRLKSVWSIYSVRNKNCEIN